MKMNAYFISACKFQEAVTRLLRAGGEVTPCTPFNHLSFYDSDYYSRKRHSCSLQRLYFQTVFVVSVFIFYISKCAVWRSPAVTCLPSQERGKRLYLHPKPVIFHRRGRLSASCMTEVLPRSEIYMRGSRMARHFRASHYDGESEHSPWC